MDTPLNDLSVTPLNKIIPLPVKNIKVAFNIRYGWEEGKILDAYQAGIEDLVNSIKTWGFKPNEPLEVYDSGEIDQDGGVIYNLAEGHRRFASVQAILSEDPDYNFGSGLSNGDVWCFVSPKPASIIDLLAAQFDANKSAKNTRLDTAKAIFTAIESGELKGAKKTVYPEIGKRIAGLTSYQSVDSFYLTYQLPESVKDWIQQSELNEDLPIALTFSTAAEIVTYYKVEDASKLLLEALAWVSKTPEKIETFGNKVTKAWLHNLAVELKLGKKPPKTKVETFAQKSPVESTQDSQKTPIPKEETETPILSTQSLDVQEFQNPDVSEYKSNDTFIEVTTNPPSAPSDPSDTPKEKVTGEKPTSEDRVKTLILKTLAEKAGDFIVNGRSDVDSGVFIVEFPQDIGEDLAELIASLLDPRSNPVKSPSASTLIDSMEF
jgi:hypothetical protein